MRNREFVKTIALMTAIFIVGSIFAFIQSFFSGIIVVVTGALMLIVFIINTKKRYKDISELSDYLYKICNNVETLEVIDNAEGELSILKSNIYKTTLKLRSQAEMLKKDKRWLSDSLADISHQLKTPITSMMVMTDLLREEELSPEKQKEFLYNIDKQLEKMQWLIVTLLKISKFDAGTIEIKQKRVNLGDVAKASVKPFLIQMELKSIELKMDIDDSYFDGDYKWTVEAVENIVKNCIEHMKENDTLSISAKENPLFTELVIADTGCGIEKEDIGHIFERFYKGKNSSPNSVGIGLALSKSIFNRENAKIEVHSTKGVGTTFNIYFYKNVV